MKVPLNWLKDYVDITLPPAELAQKLTLAGLEVEGMQVIGGSWDNIIIGQITAISPHPNADRLRLATVDLGKEKETVVCGAPNLVIGDKIAFARVGAHLINPHSSQTEELKPARIRGVLSSGMVCSEKELGISESHEGIMVLPAEAPVGMPLADYLGDTIFDIAVTANRPDCLAVIGIAREAAALSGQKVHIPEISYEETATPIDTQIAAEIADSDLCPRYCLSLITGVRAAESPRWLKERLLACGQRPINNIVDITNYVMLEYGQPLHAFDGEKIRGREIIIRRARDGETITSLDGVERKLNHDILVITDTERAVAIAGVMGGANSEITEGTTSILLEAASFNAANIHHTSRHLSLTSEASTRFERGISPELTLPALRHATQLISQLGGGEIAKGIIDVYPGKKEAKPIKLPTAEVKRILGATFSLEQITGALTSLGFTCQAEGKQVQVITPYWRSDIRQAVDLIEEVARIIGYDQIPSTLLAQPIPHPDPAPILRIKKEIRQTLVGHGFQEVITYSLTGLEMLNKVGHPTDSLIRLANPMTADQEYLRPSLRASLLTTLAANRRHEEGGLRLFELGKVYLPRGKDLPDEPEVLCGILSGPRVPKSWLGGDGSFDFYDAKGVVEGLLAHLGVATGFETGNDEGLHPTRQAAIIIEDKGKAVKLGVVGEVHPKVADAFELAGPVGLFELSVPALTPFTTGDKAFQPIPRFPSTNRDLALVVDAAITHQRVRDIIRSFNLVSEATLFDVYSGKQVAAGKKSLAYRLVYQSPTHTLTDAEVNQVQAQILKRLEKELGAKLRG